MVFVTVEPKSVIKKVAYLIILLNSYAPQIWPQPYFFLNIKEYEVTIVVATQKIFFLYTITLKKIRRTRKVKKAINIPKNVIIWKSVILEKFRKKNHQAWGYYKEEIHVTSFNSRLKRKKMNYS